MRSQRYHAWTKVYMAYRRIWYWSVYNWVHMWIFSQNYMGKCLSDQHHQKLIGGYFLEAAVTANGGYPSKNKDRLRNIKRRCSSISNISKAQRSWWWQTIHIWYKCTNQMTESWWGMQFWTELLKHLLNKTAGVSLETFWTGVLLDFELKKVLLPPPREFCRHILSWRKFQAASFKRCLHSVLRGVSLWQPVTYVTVTN